MPPLSLRPSSQRCNIWDVDPLRWRSTFSNPTLTNTTTLLDCDKCRIGKCRKPLRLFYFEFNLLITQCDDSNRPSKWNLKPQWGHKGCLIISLDDVLLIEGQSGISSPPEQRWSSSSWKPDYIWPPSVCSLVTAPTTFQAYTPWVEPLWFQNPIFSFGQFSCGRCFMISGFPTASLAFPISKM